MVEWKGELSDKSGSKARRLDELNSFSVPNFFVVTTEETEKLVKGSKDSEKMTEIELDPAVLRTVKDAYREVDMSSEIRNASGKARNLVGGQRDGSRVSVRVDAEGFQEYLLNVGSSEIEEALRKLLASHFENHESFPPIIIQKMIEPDISGSAIKIGEQVIVEAVKGYGTSLEEGITSPDLYRITDSIDKKIPDRQIESSLNPMTGDIREKETSRNAPLLKDNQLRNLAEKMMRERYAVKFAYKRGTFYAVDAFEAPEIEVTPEMDGIKVSPGEINGQSDRDFVKVSKPENPEKPMIAEKGGSTSRAAEIAREKQIPAIFNFTGEYENGNQTEEHTEESASSRTVASMTAIRVMKADRELPGDIENEFGIDFNSSYVENSDQILENQQGAIVIDFRRIGVERGMRALEMVEADFQAVIIGTPEKELVDRLVHRGIDAVASEREADLLESMVMRAERKMIVEAARKILRSRD